MKKVGFIITCMVILLGVILFLPKQKEQILVEDRNEENTNLVFMLQDEEGNYNKSDTLPSMGYTLNASKSVCSNNTTPTWEDNKLYLNNLTRNGTSCYLYFDIKPLAMNHIIANKEIRTRDDFSVTITETTTGVIYKSLDSTQYDNDGQVITLPDNQQIIGLNLEDFTGELLG